MQDLSAERAEKKSILVGTAEGMIIYKVLLYKRLHSKM